MILLRIVNALRVKNVIIKIIQISGFYVITTNDYKLLKRSGILDIARRWSNNASIEETANFVFSNLVSSKAQNQQDLWALREFMLKHDSSGKNGFFVEFGATDGILRSNTFLLEDEYDWKGILCEPAKVFHHELRMNRSARIDVRCVYSETGRKIAFHEVESQELSGLQEFKHIGGWEDARKKYTEYEVETVTLDDLLTQNDAPKRINYISIDTEGSEYEILRVFPFEKWDIECFSVEHNYSENEIQIDEHMKTKGYQRVLKEVSSQDAWYVK